MGENKMYFSYCFILYHVSTAKTSSKNMVYIVKIHIVLFMLLYVWKFGFLGIFAFEAVKQRIKYEMTQ